MSPVPSARNKPTPLSNWQHRTMSKTDERIAELTAHRACGSQEQDPQNGKLAGYCVVCQTPWPCEIAKPRSSGSRTRTVSAKKKVVFKFDERSHEPSAREIQNFCERTITDLNSGKATLRYETLEAFEKLCTRCGVSTIRIKS